MSRTKSIILIVILIIIGLYVLVLTAVPLLGIGPHGSSCYEFGYEGIYFFNQPLVLTDVGKENQRREQDDRRIACTANLYQGGVTRFEIGWLSVYITALLLLIVGAVYHRRKSTTPAQ
ncbi:hypothetical protein HY624_02490 [Candidatus Uhrbacteria bacterium]|nr:hypothetical protein [Candidatus Uhrbacteria bacterium]